MLCFILYRLIFIVSGIYFCKQALQCARVHGCRHILGKRSGPISFLYNFPTINIKFTIWYLKLPLGAIKIEDKKAKKLT